MIVHSDFSRFSQVRNPVVTIGTFDGVHSGHHAILQRLRSIAGQVNGETVVLTFYPHPRMVLNPDDHGLRLLSTPEEKTALLRSAGVDHLVVYPFSDSFSRLSAFDYVRDLLVSGLRTHSIVIGHDHRFGRNREGDFQALREYADIFGFQVEELPAQMIDDVNVSSTKIRTALSAGDVSHAKRLLGYEYTIQGTVVHGDGRGRTIGVPTANVHVDYPFKLVPAHGVYAVRVGFHEKEIPGVLNIGVRPTVHDHGRVQAEVHLLDFDQMIYGENLHLRFVQRIRDEQKFGSVPALIEQIRQDIHQARELLS